MDILWVVILLIVWFSFMAFIGVLILMDSRKNSGGRNRTSRKLERNVKRILDELEDRGELEKHKMKMEELEDLSDEDEDEDDYAEEDED